MEVLVPDNYYTGKNVTFLGAKAVTSEIDLTSSIYGSVVTGVGLLSGSSFDNATKGDFDARDNQITSNCWVSNTSTGNLVITFDGEKQISGYSIVSPQNSAQQLVFEPTALLDQNYLTNINTHVVEGFVTSTGLWVVIDTVSNTNRYIKYEKYSSFGTFSALRINITGMLFGANASIGRLRIFSEVVSWNPSKTYSKGYRVSYDNVIYESLQDLNLNKQPGIGTSAVFWLALKADNAFSLFNNKLASPFVNTNTSFTLDIKTKTKTNQAICFLNMTNRSNTGTCGSVTLYDTLRIYNPPTSASPVFSTTIGKDSRPLVAGTDQNILLKSFNFEGDRILFTATERQEYKEYLQIQISSGKPVKISELAIGEIKDLGLSQYGATAGITDYSVKTTDQYGNSSFTKRDYAKKMTIKADVPNASVNSIQQTMYDLRATPAVWIGSSDSRFSTPLIVYGIFKDFSTSIDYPNHSMISFDIEGLA
jgi:hypothetical protein